MVTRIFLGFLEICDSTEKGLSMYLFHKLKELQLDIKNLCGQAYENGANM